MTKKIAVAVALVGAVLLAPAATWAKGKDRMNIEDGVLDEIHLKVERIATGIPVVIRTFPADNASLGSAEEGGENKQRAAGTMVKVAPDLLTRTLAGALQQSRAFGEVLIDPDAAPPAGAIVVEGEFVSIDPGSRAKRYFVGFGAGKSGVGVTGTVKDAGGELLAEFNHRKHSGIGIGGGDYVKFLSDDTEDVAKDIAQFLAGWARGEDLTKD
jgi:hypothetical protein